MGTLKRLRVRCLVWAAGVVLCSVALSACDSFDSVPDGQIRIKNDFGGEEFSTLHFSANGKSYTLKSREWVLLPRGTTTIFFTYAGPKNTRRYKVVCPAQLEKGITIKLIDVHSNKIAGGCSTVEYSRE